MPYAQTEYFHYADGRAFSSRLQRRISLSVYLSIYRPA